MDWIGLFRRADSLVGNVNKIRMLEQCLGADAESKPGCSDQVDEIISAIDAAKKKLEEQPSLLQAKEITTLIRQGIKFGDRLRDNATIRALKCELRERTGCIFSKSKSKGDCFYDSFAQALVLSMHGKAPNFKQLRMICNEYAVQGHVPAWMQKIGDPEAGYNSFGEYQQKVQYTIEEAEVNCADKLAVWGTPEVDGRILCEHFGKTLHTIEIDTDTIEGEAIVHHQLVTPNGDIKLYGSDRDINYHDSDILHIICARRHYVPLLPIDYVLSTLPKVALDGIRATRHEADASSQPFGFDQLLTAINRVRTALVIRSSVGDGLLIQQIDDALNILQDLPEDIEVEIALNTESISTRGGNVSPLRAQSMFSQSGNGVSDYGSDACQPHRGPLV
ncbi:MAG: hypothetical protein KAT71_02870 [Gammaproteobacteria bacterium]|nr:hypothetical protein [Gammaproteobacteria bacterium]